TLVTTWHLLADQHVTIQGGGQSIVLTGPPGGLFVPPDGRIFLEAALERVEGPGLEVRPDVMTLAGESDVTVSFVPTLDIAFIDMGSRRGYRVIPPMSGLVQHVQEFVDGFQPFFQA